MYTRIITHNDFDGIVSAALCALYYKVSGIFFTGPTAILDKSVLITAQDIVCDLPYATNCGLWFDHHMGNKEELKCRGIELDTLPGCFGLKPSCARVIYEYLYDKTQWPAYMKGTVDETDIIDAFAYSSAEDWRKRTPGHLIHYSLSLPFGSRHEENNYMRQLVFAVRDHTLPEIVEFDWVKPRVEKYLEEESNMLKIIQESVTFLSKDMEKEMPIVDLTKFNRQPYIVRPLVFMFYPQAKAVIVVQNQFNRGVKLNDLSISMSLGFQYYNKPHGKDVGAIMNDLGLGDGHAGAAGGRIRCASKQDMLKKKDQILSQIYVLWKKQPDKQLNSLF